MAKKVPVKRKAATRRKPGRAGSRRRKTRRRSGLRRFRLRALGWPLIAALVGAAAVAVWLVWPFWRLSGQFTDRPDRQPTRLYARPLTVVKDGVLHPSALAAELGGLGYRATDRSPGMAGTYRHRADAWEIFSRSAPTPAGWRPPVRIGIRIVDGRVRELAADGAAVTRLALEPQLVGSYVGDHLEDRWLVALGDLPDHLVKAVLAAEDATFYEHPGISLSGLVRAMAVNVRLGELSHGGSTLTQQLVKNVFLSPERKVSRKLREGVLSLLLEMRFEKSQILEAYLNEIYWGRNGRMSLMGVGAAARAYFGKPPQELDVAEAATLAGMIRTPGNLDPRRDPEPVRRRRDQVLGLMAELGWLDAVSLDAALAAPVELVDPRRTAVYRGHFLDTAGREARRRFGVSALPDAGLSVLSTLEAASQSAAERAVESSVAALESGGAKAGLEAALVAADPRTGEVTAYVGGRDYGRSQYDRVSSARRQPGSAFKPLVFAAALRYSVATPSTLVEDGPLSLQVGGQSWEPQNYDRRFHGTVTARTVLEESLNVATVRLGAAVGWREVVETANELGVESSLSALPSVALGALEVSPMELLAVYSTFAAGGVRRPLHLVTGVLDADGAPIRGSALPEPRRVQSGAEAYVLTHMLEGVVERGTGRSVRRLGFDAYVAGKTGTSNEARDNWFVGYSANRATLVWVGYDDGRATSLSGARGALPAWVEFSLASSPSDGYLAIRAPRTGVEWVAIDPLSGGRLTDRCPSWQEEAFVHGTAPREPCYLHSRGRRMPELLGEGSEREEDGRRRGWWRRVFGRRDDRD